MFSTRVSKWVRNVFIHHTTKGSKPRKGRRNFSYMAHPLVVHVVSLWYYIVKHPKWIPNVQQICTNLPCFFSRLCSPLLPFLPDNMLPCNKSPNAHFQRLAVHQRYHHKSTSFTSSIKWDEYWSAKEDLFISSSIQRSTASSFWGISEALTAQSYRIHDTGLDISVLEENQTVNSVQ